MERGRADGASWALPHQENQPEAPAYLDPAGFCAETSPSPWGLNEQHPCYWPGFRGPTGWGLPCESAPCRVASKWWLNTGLPTFLCRPSPTLARQVLCPPAVPPPPFCQARGWALLTVAGEHLQPVLSVWQCVRACLCQAMKVTVVTFKPPRRSALNSLQDLRVEPLRGPATHRGHLS